MASARELLGALRDPVKFAEVLCGAALWPHQVEVIRSAARYRILCAGRQAGKSRLFAVMALHKAFSQPGAVILIISAGETAAQRLLAEVSALASSPLLTASVTDETKGTVTLSNGSQILSVPASQKQIRGWAIDLLIMDEAGFIDPAIWRAAEPVIIARPGSKVIMCSSPWGSGEHFFRQMWQRGTDSPDAMYEAWHWPSSISPLVDKKLLDEIRKREGDAYFNREYLALWEDDAGAFLTEEEISSAVASYELVPPERAGAWSPWDRWTERRERCYTAAAGVDWAYSRDAQALVLISALDDGQLNHGPGAPLLPAVARVRVQDTLRGVGDESRGLRQRLRLARMCIRMQRRRRPPHAGAVGRDSAPGTRLPRRRGVDRCPPQDERLRDDQDDAPAEPPGPAARARAAEAAAVPGARAAARRVGADLGSGAGRPRRPGDGPHAGGVLHPAVHPR